MWSKLAFVASAAAFVGPRPTRLAPLANNPLDKLGLEKPEDVAKLKVVTDALFASDVAPTFPTLEEIKVMKVKDMKTALERRIPRVWGCVAYAG